MCQSDLHERDPNEWEQFASHPRFRTLCNEFYDIVRITRPKCLTKMFTPLNDEDYAQAVAVHGEKVEEILMTYNGYSEARFETFLKTLFSVVQQRAGKKNTFCIIGRSNSGKTSLMLSFVKKFFGHDYGTPSNNPNTSFMFNDCTNKRIIFADEAMVHEKNYEDWKKIMGGQTCRTEVKYKEAIDIQPTPVIYVSNSEIWKNLPVERDAFKNRIYHFTMNTPIPNSSECVPIEDIDWDIVLTKYWKTLKLDKCYYINKKI
jgi:phage/plasmid-associated DNA primase